VVWNFIFCIIHEMGAIQCPYFIRQLSLVTFCLACGRYAELATLVFSTSGHQVATDAYVG